LFPHTVNTYLNANKINSASDDTFETSVKKKKINTEKYISFNFYRQFSFILKHQNPSLQFILLYKYLLCYITKCQL